MMDKAIFPETEEGFAALLEAMATLASPPDPPPMEKLPGSLWGLPPGVFERVRWHGQTSACPAERLVGLTLRREDGSLIRVAVDVQELRAIAARIQFYRPYGCQSPRSSDSPTAPQSPHEGQSQVPPATSSTACCGDA